MTPTITVTPTITLTPTLTPTPTGTASGTASPSAVTVTSPANNASIASQTPTFQGKAPAGATVTITIYSTPVTVTVTADANGNWIYTPTTPLDAGPHSVVVSAPNPGSGTPVTATSAFVVAGGGTATESAVPVSGTVETTFLLLAIGLVLTAAGALVPVFVR